MGTRADFYKETPDGLFWIASIGWDGYPEGIYTKDEDENGVVTTQYITDCEDEERYLAFLADLLSPRDDVTYPQQGWPWPWANSLLTDYAYVFSNDRKEVLIANFGRGWFNQKEWEELEDLPDEMWKNLARVDNFPDMTDQMKVTFDKRSGLLILESRGKNE